MSNLASFVAPPDQGPECPLDITKQTQLATETYQALLSFLRRDNRLREGVNFVAHDAWESSTDVILNHQAQHLGEVRIRGLSFKPRRDHAGDSQVLFISPHSQTEGALSLGQIEDIFVHRRASADQSTPRDQTFIALRRFAGLTEKDQKHDPFKPFRHLRMRLLYQKPISDIMIVPITDVVAHFASCPFADDILTRRCMVAVPLDRVSSYLRYTYSG